MNPLSLWKTGSFGFLFFFVSNIWASKQQSHSDHGLHLPSNILGKFSANTL